MTNNLETVSIRRLLSPRPNLLIFEILAKIRKNDIEYMADQVKTAFVEYDKIDMLLFIKNFEGMDAGAVFDGEGLDAQVKSVRHVRKYGVVGAPAWARATIEAFDFISPVEAKTFGLEEQLEAYTWIEAL